MAKGNFKIGEIHAFISVDPVDGDEGVISIERQRPGKSPVLLPLIAADPKRLMECDLWAREIAQEQNIMVKHVKFTSRVDVKEIVP